MECYNCQEELIQYAQSKEIPKHDNVYYIICNNCKNVMKARIKNDKIKDLVETSTKKGFATRKEMMEALKLFEGCNLEITGYSVNNSESSKVNLNEDKNIIKKAKDFLKTIV